MAVLKPSVNAFSLLESNDPGDTRLGDVGAPAAKVDAAAVSRPVNINRKQQPQMSVWKANKVKAEANAAKNTNKQQPAASRGKISNSAAANAGGNGKNRKPPQQPAASKVQPSGAAANAAGKYKKPPPQPAAYRASQPQAKTAANYGGAGAAASEQFEQRSPAPVSLTQILFGNAYPSARALIYKNRKQNAAANAKDGGASATTDDKKKGVHANGATAKEDGPAPVQEEPPAPVKPVLPPPPPPSLHDSAQFPCLK